MRLTSTRMMPYHTVSAGFFLKTEISVEMLLGFQNVWPDIRMQILPETVRFLIAIKNGSQLKKVQQDRRRAFRVRGCHERDFRYSD